MGSGGRHRQQRSYNHRCQYHSNWDWGDWYEISWTVDRYVSGSRLRFPATYTRDTDEAGARRFCKKWGIPLPENLQEAAS